MRYLLLLMLLAGCGTTQSTTFSTTGEEMTAAEAASPSPTIDAATLERARNELRAGVGSAGRQIEEWQGHIQLLRDHAIAREYEDALVSIGEEMTDWIDAERDELRDAVIAPCIEKALTAYQAALDEIETTTDRLFEAGQDADSRVVRALAALEDATDALDEVAGALPESCRTE